MTTSKKFSQKKLEQVSREVGLMRFMAETMLKICDNLDTKLGYVKPSSETDKPSSDQPE